MVPYSTPPRSPERTAARWPARLTGVVLAVLLALAGGAAPSSLSAATTHALGASAPASPHAPAAPAGHHDAGHDHAGHDAGAYGVPDRADGGTDSDAPHLQGRLAHPAHFAHHTVLSLPAAGRQEHRPRRSIPHPAPTRTRAAPPAHHSPQQGRAPPRTGV